jgi:hypothetical protein
MAAKSLYEVIQDIVSDLREGKVTHRQGVVRLMHAGLNEPAAEKMMDRLVKQVEDE